MPTVCVSLEDTGLGDTSQTHKDKHRAIPPIRGTRQSRTHFLPAPARHRAGRRHADPPAFSPWSAAVGSVSPEAALGPGYSRWRSRSARLPRWSLAPLSIFQTCPESRICFILGGFQTRVTKAGRAPASRLQAQSDPASPATSAGSALLSLGSALPVGLT